MPQLEDGAQQGLPPASLLAMVLATHRLLVAVAAFILFEYVITLRDEITVIWQRKLSPTSFLLLSIRWTLLVEAIFILLPQPDMQRYRQIDLCCSPRTVMILVPVLVGAGQTAVFSALRVFALWNHSYRIAAVVLVLGLAPVFFNAWVLARNSAPMAFAGKELFLCNQTRILTGSLNHGYALGSRLPVVVAEAIVLALTWMKTYRCYRDSWRVGISTSLTACLLRDGSIYFAVLVLINVAQIALIFNPSNISSVTAFLDVVPPVLTSRFILNLRNVAFDTAHDTAIAPSRAVFTRPTQMAKSAAVTALDDLGEPLDVDEVFPSRAESQRGFRDEIQMSTVVYKVHDTL